MPVRVLGDEEAGEIRSFITENAEYFARWYNAEADRDSADWLFARLADGWLLANANIPGMFGPREEFIGIWPSLYGSAQGDPVTSRIEFREVWELADGVYLAAYVQHFDSQTGSRSHPETTILMRHAATGELKVHYVHE